MAAATSLPRTHREGDDLPILWEPSDLPILREGSDLPILCEPSDFPRPRMPEGFDLPIPLEGSDLPILCEESDIPSVPLTRHESGSLSSSPPDAGSRASPLPGAPTHPIPAMQAAFEESLMEVTNGTGGLKPKFKFADAKERRQVLLDGRKDAPLRAEKWRHRPGQTHHELWKLLSQIAFGVYLSLNGIANSNVQVVNILQGHIDEVDEFLETTMEDVNLAIDDVKERIDFLKLPMDNMATFEKMLEDRAFRLQIVSGNEKIEHIVSRTHDALEATLNDVDEGLKATTEFAAYLVDQQNRSWREERPDVVDIFDAMKGNAEGWFKAFADLQQSGAVLDTLLVRIGKMVTEMDRRAGEVSRRTRLSHAPSFELNIRASALMPLGFNLPQFSEQRGSGTSSSLGVSSNSSSQRSSQRSSTSRPPSDLRSVRSMSSRLSVNTAKGPLSPSAMTTSTLTEFHYVPSERDSTSPLPTAKTRGSFTREKVLPAETVMEAAEDEDGSLAPAEDMGAEREARISVQRPHTIVDEGLYLLQPRTYTPQPPEPLPSPGVPNRSSRQALQEREIPAPSDPPPAVPLVKKTSLRQRLSLKGNNPPESIQVPARSERRLKIQAPKQAPDSAHVSDSEARQRVLSISDSLVDLTPPEIPNTVSSPHSEHHYFRPVPANPHSPLQQRPWTSHATSSGPARPHTSATHRANHDGHLRNQPSAMGMSVMSRSTMNPDSKTLKKKKSAFGWLKKAFSLDEEERAAFEARRLQQQQQQHHHHQMHNQYADDQSPKWLDGRRIR